jgi:hypothetical protein
MVSQSGLWDAAAGARQIQTMHKIKRQHSTAQRSTAQHSTAQHSTAQHSTAHRQTRSACTSQQTIATHLLV